MARRMPPAHARGPIRAATRRIRAVGELDPAEVEATVPDDVLAAFRAWRRGEPVAEG